METRTQNAETVSQMKDLLSFEHRKTIVKYLGHKLEAIEDEIFAWSNEEYNKIKYTQYDILKAERNAMKAMLWLPWAIIAHHESIKPPDYADEV